MGYLNLVSTEPAAGHTIRFATEAGRCVDGALLAFRAENPHIEFTDVRIEITFEKADPLKF